MTLPCIVIGGGITGAGIAPDAADQGMNVALLEKMICFGNEQQSTKLIHGGASAISNNLRDRIGAGKQVEGNRPPPSTHLVLAENVFPSAGGTFGPWWAPPVVMFVYDLFAGVNRRGQEKNAQQKANAGQGASAQRAKRYTNGRVTPNTVPMMRRLTIDNIKQPLRMAPCASIMPR